MRDLTARVVVVTGAGSGIGLATARAFAAEGARVHVVDVDPERVASAAAEVDGRGHVVDCREPEALQALARDVLSEEGRVDVLHNNAGVGLGKSFLDTTPEDWEWITSLNLFGVVHGTRAFLPAMLERGEGVVVNTASLLGLTGSPDLSAYCTTKWAVLGLTESLRLEHAGRGVHFMAVCPGLIATNIVRDGRVAIARDPGGARAVAQWDRYGSPPEVVARDVVRGVKRRAHVVLTPRHARVLAAIRALSPRVQHWLLSRLERA